MPLVFEGIRLTLTRKMSVAAGTAWLEMEQCRESWKHSNNSGRARLFAKHLALEAKTEG